MAQDPKIGQSVPYSAALRTLPNSLYPEQFLWPWSITPPLFLISSPCPASTQWVPCITEHVNGQATPGRCWFSLPRDQFFLHPLCEVDGVMTERIEESNLSVSMPEV